VFQLPAICYEGHNPQRKVAVYSSPSFSYT
jgi:hypothetical protein